LSSFEYEISDEEDGLDNREPSQAGAGDSKSKFFSSTKSKSTVKQKRKRPFKRVKTKKTTNVKRKEKWEKSTGGEKLDHFLVYCYQFTIEMSLVDLIFSTTFNI
jgi:hypothetical protein